MIPIQGIHGQKIAILGLARSGLAVARAIEQGGGAAFCWDDDKKARMNAHDQGFVLCDLNQESAFADISKLIISPGIPHLYPTPHPIVKNALACCVVLDNDIGLFFSSFGQKDWTEFAILPKIIAVTGSNGKSTVTALIAHLLKKAGRPYQIGGNFGRAVFDLNPPQAGEIIVLELSSYQCELARTLSPDIAVFTNFSCDHYERHGGKGGYFGAKARLFTQGAPERAIIGIDENEGKFLKNQYALYKHDDCVLSVSTQEKRSQIEWSFIVNKGFLSEYRRGKQVAAWDLRTQNSLQGVHNYQNIAHGVAVVRSLGVAPHIIKEGLASFKGLAHRCEHIACIDGVSFVNDSKATNSVSAIKALQNFKKIRWILGGKAKSGGIGDVLPYLRTVVKAYLIGEAATDFSKTLSEFPHDISYTLESAVESAFKDAAPDETVLLSPAAASFDQFENFEDRGKEFVRLVEKLKA